MTRRELLEAFAAAGFTVVFGGKGEAAQTATDTPDTPDEFIVNGVGSIEYGADRYAIRWGGKFAGTAGAVSINAEPIRVPSPDHFARHIRNPHPTITLTDFRTTMVGEMPMWSDNVSTLEIYVDGEWMECKAKRLRSSFSFDYNGYAEGEIEFEVAPD